MIEVTWAEVGEQVDDVARRWRHYGSVYGVPTGGSVVAAMLSERHLFQLLDRLPDAPPADGVLVVDDLVDSGVTLQPYMTAGWDVDALFRKPHSPNFMATRAKEVDGWLSFPWEHDGGAPTDAVTRLLEFVGEDPSRDGLKGTPGRVTRALAEMTDGYAQDPKDLLDVTFDVAYDEMVVVRGVKFASLCEHHMLPFTGVATVGYIPRDRVVGLSKLARLVDVYAHRLQVQERLTNEIAQAILEHVNPAGVGVVITAHHECMGVRGAKRPDATMTTSALHGAMREDPAARAEFLALGRA